MYHGLETYSLANTPLKAAHAPLAMANASHWVLALIAVPLTTWPWLSRPSYDGGGGCEGRRECCSRCEMRTGDDACMDVADAGCQGSTSVVLDVLDVLEALGVDGMFLWRSMEG